MKQLVAIKRYFEAEPYGRKVTPDEIRALDKTERRELGMLACVELGQEFEESEAA